VKVSNKNLYIIIRGGQYYKDEDGTNEDNTFAFSEERASNLTDITSLDAKLYHECSLSYNRVHFVVSFNYIVLQSKAVSLGV